jgi:hypothetical protein
MKNLDIKSPISVAFHFQYLQRGETNPATPVHIKLLERVLIGLIQHLKQTGSLVIRMGQLFYTQHLDSELEIGWRESVSTEHYNYSPKWSSECTANVIPLDRIYVVTVTGELSELINQLIKQLSRYRKYRFLYALEVSTNNKYHDVIYRSMPSVVGILHPSGELESAFSSVEFEPYLSAMLKRIEIPSYFSGAAIDEIDKLVNGH